MRFSKLGRRDRDPDPAPVQDEPVTDSSPARPRLGAEDLVDQMTAELDDRELHDAVHQAHKAEGVKDTDHAHSRRAFVVASASALGGAAGFAALGPMSSTALAATAADLPGVPHPKLSLSQQTYYWAADNVSSAYFVPGINAMKILGSLFGVKTEFIGPTIAGNVGQETANWQALIAKPDTAGIDSYFAESASAAATVYASAHAKGIAVAQAAGDWASPTITTVFWAPMAVAEAAASVINSALGGKGTVGAIGNLSGSAVNMDVIYFAEILKTKYPGLKFVGKTSYDGTPAGAVSQYGAFVNAHTPDCMWYADGSGSSIVAGLLSASPHKPKLMLRGYASAAFEAVKSGQAIGTADRNVYEEEFWAFTSLMMQVNLDTGAPSQIDLVIHTVTKDNVAAYIKSPQFSLTKYI
jgi:hypothetical protein